MKIINRLYILTGRFFSIAVARISIKLGNGANPNVSERICLDIFRPDVNRVLNVVQNEVTDFFSNDLSMKYLYIT